MILAMAELSVNCNVSFVRMTIVDAAAHPGMCAHRPAVS
jgi:hypothetical protein